jgi:pSer/pThr/pTyr-binding forkhead associated (FHA) protein
MAKIICTAGPNLGDQWEVHLGTTSIGRQPDNTIALHDPKVSRHHAVIKFDDDKYSIEDLESLNGTHIFGKRVIRAVLALETPFQIGNSTLLLTRKNLHDIGLQHVEAVGDDLFRKHKSKQAVMSEILQDLHQAKSKEGEEKKGFLRKLKRVTQKVNAPPPKKTGLGML